VEPEVLLLDEPTSALDPTATLEIENLVSKLNRKLNLTVLFVTHDIQQARRLGHKSVVIIKGRKVEEGMIKNLFSSPQSGLTKRFLEGNLKEES
jgi:putative ABC transport system ATP-binding protein